MLAAAGSSNVPQPGRCCTDANCQYDKSEASRLRLGKPERGYLCSSTVKLTAAYVHSFGLQGAAGDRWGFAKNLARQKLAELLRLSRARASQLFKTCPFPGHLLPCRALEVTLGVGRAAFSIRRVWRCSSIRRGRSRSGKLLSLQRALDVQLAELWKGAREHFLIPEEPIFGTTAASRFLKFSNLLVQDCRVSSVVYVVAVQQSKKRGSSCAPRRDSSPVATEMCNNKKVFARWAQGAWHILCCHSFRNLSHKINMVQSLGVLRPSQQGGPRRTLRTPGHQAYGVPH